MSDPVVRAITCMKNALIKKLEEIRVEVSQNEPGKNHAYIPLDQKCVKVDGVPMMATPVVVMDATMNTEIGILYRDRNNVVITGTVTPADPCDCPCPECGECSASILMDAYDQDRGLLQAGETTRFEILLDGASQATIDHDYTTTADGVNVSTWYTPITAAINAVPGWSIAVDTDVPAADQGKVRWLVSFSGEGPSELQIVKGSDVLTISVDEDCVITGASDDGGTGNPFGSDPFSPAPDNTTPNAFDLRAFMENPTTATKVGLDSPDNQNAYFDVPDGWTVANLIDALNANAANATPGPDGPIPSGVDYTGTVFAAHPTLPNVIVVASGNVPNSIDLISVPQGFPVVAL